MIRYALGIVVIMLALAGGAAPVFAHSAFNANGVAVAAVEQTKFTGPLATFSDPGQVNPKYTATIDWGDNTPLDTGTVVSLGKSNYEVDGSHNYVEEGTYQLHVAITGGTGGSTSPTATVADAPLTATVSVPTRAESSALDGVVATFVDPDPYDNATEYSAKIDWGDGTTSAGAITKTNNGPPSATFSVSGNHAWPDEGARTVAVTVTAAGKFGATVTATQAVNIVDAALTPGPTVAGRGTEGKALASGVVGTFQDANTGAAATDFTATINWGDGTSGPGTVGPAAGGGWQVTGGHTYREEGALFATVGITDKGGASTTAHARFAIADAPLHATARRFAVHGGRRFQSPVATFVDAAGAAARASDFHATINWGDGHSSAGTVSGSRGHFTVAGSHSYVTTGTKHVTVSIRDRGGATATAHSQATVS